MYKYIINTIIAISAMTLTLSASAFATPKVTCDLELNYLNHSESIHNSSTTLNKCFELSFAQGCKNICKKEHSNQESCNKKCIQSSKIASATCSTATDASCSEIAKSARKSAQPAAGVSTASRGLLATRFHRVSPLLTQPTQKNRTNSEAALITQPSNNKDESHSKSGKKTTKKSGLLIK